ncbi:hypothetical protein Tco_1175158 [Tanacetum coccineum]
MATPFANPERQFRAKRDTSPAPIHNIYSFFESESFESESEDALKSIQELADHSYKWHNVERENNTPTPFGIITVKLKALNNEMDTLRVDVRKINTNGEKKSLHEEIKSIRTKINEFDEPRNLEDLLLSNDINEDLGSFLKDNDLLSDLENQDTMSLSPLGSARLNNDSSGMFCNPNSNSSISLDDFIKMDDVWDNLDFRDLTNEATNSPVKPKFLSSGNRIHLHSPYNL